MIVNGVSDSNPFIFVVFFLNQTQGAGKPLPERVVYNPYEDFTTHKMNEILVEGGFAPEWITLQVGF